MNERINIMTSKTRKPQPKTHEADAFLTAQEIMAELHKAQSASVRQPDEVDEAVLAERMGCSRQTVMRRFLKAEAQGLKGTRREVLEAGAWRCVYRLSAPMLTAMLSGGNGKGKPHA